VQKPLAIGATFSAACVVSAEKVVTRVGALGSMVRDGETGRVVEPGNSRALGEALVELLSDPEKCRRYGEAGRRYALEHGTWDAVGDKLCAAIRIYVATR